MRLNLLYVNLLLNLCLSCECVCVRAPALWVIHEEQVEQSVSSIRQPDEFILQVVVWLLLQTVLTDEGKLRETLAHTHTQEVSFDTSLLE